eukprot:TRINITY_DN1980_c3_g1_i1.p1 TRINITY_DN1980_c3_g1~~TRINITY_DN1980_c3_g1_i1.p1  ORF type:complete len:879 (-),score=208.25 TRINITY_DN1980_c3_g1_i1:193-2829(-)
MMNPRQDGKKDDDEFEAMPFQGIDKSLVLQEKRIFNETPLNPRKCCHLLTKILYLLAQGETFTTNEATDLFFAVTKLFQSKDIILRRIVYQVLKELSVFAEDVIIIISSLTKDMNSKTDLYKANSIRVLCKILTDVSLLGQGERYLKQAIVDKEPYVASAALVSGTHLLQTVSNTDLVKRWFSEIQDATKSKSPMVQYHALGLLYQLKQHDRLAVSKLVTTMTRSSVRSPYAHCLLIRFTSQVLNEEGPENRDRSLLEYLDSCLRHKTDMVEFEAARAICNLKDVTARELTPAISVLQLFLSSPKPTLRFAATRTLNKVAITHPLAVTVCNLDLENLITDSNRYIATLSITTLLKTGSEVSIDRLMKQIANFMSEISDEFKIVVVDAIRSLCLKFPQKYRSLMNFLSTILREEGGFEYKKTIVETILTVINDVPNAKEVGLSHLCEFIEDCEYTFLSTKILHLLGTEGPNTTTPSKFIRYIYNRVILENANVRASAVSALAKFGAKLDALRPNILILLRRCLVDSDDEVRDRATLYVNLLEKAPELAKTLILKENLNVPLANLERSLLEYNGGPTDEPFDISVVSTAVELPKVQKKRETRSAAAAAAPVPAKKAESSFAEALTQIPQFAGLGNLLRSTKSVELTESETEYVVNCIKHIFSEHIVFQFNVTNTLNDQLLENVSVKMEPESSDFTVETEIPAPKLIYQVPGVIYALVALPGGSYPTGTFSNTLKFVVKEIDTASGEAEEEGREDEYQIEDIEVSTCDYIQKRVVTNFQEDWESLGEDAQAVETMALSTMKTLQDAVNEISEFLGMQPVDQSEKVPANKQKHILYLAGTFVGGIPVLARARMKLESTGGVSMELTVRSTDPDISASVATAL